MFVSPPGVDGREHVLGVHTKGKPLAPSVDLRLLARQTAGLSGADLANICNEAAIFCARRGGQMLAKEDFEGALERVVAGMQSRRTLTEHERKVVAFHEAGHALCAELLPSVDPVHKISIVPRGRALGYTLNLPEEDRYLKTRDELVDFMTMLLGGRAAERIVFGEVTTGASDDLKRVTEIAHAMVTEYAMGTSIVSQQAGSEELSEHLRRLRDEERADLTDQAFRQALELIVAYRPQLDALAASLLEHEGIDREEIDRVMTGVTPPARVKKPGGELRIAAAPRLRVLAP